MSRVYCSLTRPDQTAYIFTTSRRQRCVGIALALPILRVRFFCFWRWRLTLLRGMFRIFAVPFLLLLASIPAFSQTGAITGKATDGTGGLIPGVEVSISSPAMIGGARSAPTDETGGYRFTLLPPGVYRVSFALSGFKTL